MSDCKTMPVYCYLILIKLWWSYNQAETKFRTPTRVGDGPTRVGAGPTVFSGAPDNSSSRDRDEGERLLPPVSHHDRLTSA